MDYKSAFKNVKANCLESYPMGSVCGKEWAAEAPPLSPLSPVDREMERLDKLAEMCDETVGALERKLHVVLGPELGKPDGGRGSTASECILTQRIHDATERISASMCRIHGLIDRIRL